MQPEQSSQLPPHSEPAEKGVLGGVLRWNAAMDTVASMLDAGSFYIAPHRDVFQAMLNLHAARKPIDVVSVYESLPCRVAGFNYPGLLAELWDSTPTGANTEYHAAIVKDRAVRRALIRTANEVARDAYDGVAPAADLLAEAETALSNIRLAGSRGELPATLDQTIDQVVARIDERAVKKDAGAVMTGLYQLDQMTGGLFPGEMITLAARPSVGKSALAQAIAINAARSGKSVLFVALEMTRIDVGQRLLVNESSIPNWRVRNSKLDQPDVNALTAAAERLRGAKVRFDDEPGLSMSRFAAKCRVLKRREGLDLVLLDYLGLLRPDNTRLPRHEQVSSMSRAIKMLAQELQLPIVVLSQLNRDADDSNRPPRLSDIRESGAVEQDSDCVLFLHRPSEDRADPEPLDLIMAKNRQGETGLLRLMYRGQFFRFEQDVPRM